MSITPLTFTGVSQFSNDFQTILSRAQQIAQIPLKALQNSDSDALQKKTLLSSLNGAVSSLADSLSALGKAGSGRGLAASSSDSTVVTAVNSGATSPASYIINSITSVASAASERSLIGYADASVTPVSSTGTVKLVLGGQSKTLTPAANTLIGFRDAINASGLAVTASILTAPGGNYLSVSANAAGATTLSLLDDPDHAATNLLTASNQGSSAVFKLNGINVTQSGNVVNNIVPGLTFTLLKSSDTAVTLTLASDRTTLANALQGFVTSYNSLRKQVSAQVGPAAGLLSGDTAIGQIQSELRQIVSERSSTGSVRSLADLGVTFSLTGEASFDQTAFDSLSDQQVSDGFTFAGSATTGLGRFASALTQISDPIGGLIKTEQDGYDRTDQKLQSQMTALNDRIATMTASLNAKLQAADALLATLESQQKTLTASLQGLNAVLYGKGQQ